MEVDTQIETKEELTEPKEENLVSEKIEEEPEQHSSDDEIKEKLVIVSDDDNTSESKVDKVEDGVLSEIETEIDNEKKGEKRKQDDFECSSDDEDFVGFEDPVEPPMSKAKKMKEEVLSDQENDTSQTSIKDALIDDENEQSIQSLPEEESSQSVSTPSKRSIYHRPVTDPIYRRPFEYGWKRELVYRAVAAISKEKGEVYYITPAGKKLRTRAEIAANLHDDLTLDNFTLVKEPVGANPDQEIIRSAKTNAATIKRASNTDATPTTPDLSTGLGKRVPKPKAPKGASPPLPNRSVNKNRVSATSMATASPKSGINATKPPVKDNRTDELMDMMSVMKNKGTPKGNNKNSKPKGEPCTIQCLLAMGTIPQLQCRKCLCLYHHECVGVERFDHPVQSYICESCLQENITGQTAKNQSKTNKSQSSHQQNVQKTNSKQSRSHVPKENVVDSMTTWLPVTSNIIKNRSQLGNDETPPQTIAVVAGRKYIVVPKTNVLSVSPSDGGDKNGDRKGSDSNGFESEDIVLSTKKRPSALGKVATNTPSSSPARSATASVVEMASTLNNSKLSSESSKTTSVNNLFGKSKKSSSSGSNKNIISCSHPNSSYFFSNVAVGYDVLLQTFQYLKVKELLRASCVCRVWNQAANHPSLWKTVRMKNSQVNDWSGLASTLRRNGTKHLDLRKMLISSNADEMWSNFSKNIGTVENLENIDLCRCSSSVVENLFKTNANLRVLNAVMIKDEDINLDDVSNLKYLKELRLKPENWINIKTDLTPLKDLNNLRHLALTFIKKLGTKNIEILSTLTNLESLEIGECSDISLVLSQDVLPKLKKLDRLRLEKGQDNCSTTELLSAISKMENLQQLELVNFDIKPKFNDEISQCVNIKKLLIIPTYISQSATTNNMILSGMIKLADSLTAFTWVVTQELLRVTELYVVQCDGSKKDKRLPDESIPILKPVPGIGDEEQSTSCSEVPQVEIVPLVKVERILHNYLPRTYIKILKANYNTTWRQNLVEGPATF